MNCHLYSANGKFCCHYYDGADGDCDGYYNLDLDTFQYRFGFKC